MGAKDVAVHAQYEQKKKIDSKNLHAKKESIFGINVEISKTNAKMGYTYGIQKQTFEKKNKKCKIQK